MTHERDRTRHARHRRDPRRQDGDPRRRRGPRERGRPRDGRRAGHARGHQLHGHATGAASSASLIEERDDRPARAAADGARQPGRRSAPRSPSSIEARHGVTTGISARDRATHDPRRDRRRRRPDDLVTPGHVFPLRARKGGVLVRTGQTEGSVDLARLAGLEPAGVICEIMRDDGAMARMPDLEEFAAEARPAASLTIADLIEYRLQRERSCAAQASGAMRPRLARPRRAVRRALLRDRRRGHRVPRARAAATSPAASAQGGAGARARRGDGSARRSVRPAAAICARALEAIDEAGAACCSTSHRGRMRAAASFERLVLQHDVARPSVARLGPTSEALRDFGLGAQVLADLGLPQDPPHDQQRPQDRRPRGLRHRGRRARAAPAACRTARGSACASSSAQDVSGRRMPTTIEGDPRPPTGLRVRDRREPLQRHSSSSRWSRARSTRSCAPAATRRRHHDRALPRRVGAAAGRAARRRARRRRRGHRARRGDPRRDAALRLRRRRGGQGHRAASRTTRDVAGHLRRAHDRHASSRRSSAPAPRPATRASTRRSAAIEMANAVPRARRRQREEGASDAWAHAARAARTRCSCCTRATATPATDVASAATQLGRARSSSRSTRPAQTFARELVAAAIERAAGDRRADRERRRRTGASSACRASIATSCGSARASCSRSATCRSRS